MNEIRSDAVIRRAVDLDVSVAVGDGELHHLSVLMVAPAPGGVRPRWLLFCVPGGSYRSTYWDFHAPGRSGYSFAEYAAGQGAVVVGIDNLGTGGSSRPGPPVNVTVDLIARANACALSAIRSRLHDGVLIPGLPPAVLPVVGIGHSMGGFAVLVQQGATAPFGRLAILGTTVQPLAWLPEHLRDRTVPEDGRRRELGSAVSLSAWGVPFERSGGYVSLNRATYARHFYSDDVPPDVIAADMQEATVVPRAAALDVLLPDRWPELAATIRCPVLLAFGDPDLSPDPVADVAAFSAAADVRLVRVPASAHCHNLAEGRWHLWQAIIVWLREAAPTDTSGEPR